MSDAIKERPIIFSGAMVRAILEGRKTMTRRIVKLRSGGEVVVFDGKVWKPAKIGYEGYIDCPYGKPSDRLWVRERGWISKSKTNFIPFEGNTEPPGRFKSPNGDPYKVCPAIHMPRWASRVTLEITTVRVERLNEISGQDCLAEGIPKQRKLDDGVPLRGDVWSEAKSEFKTLWESIHGEGSWAANPWVWVISFRRRV